MSLLSSLDFSRAEDARLTPSSSFLFTVCAPPLPSKLPMRTISESSEPSPKPSPSLRRSSSLHSVRKRRGFLVALSSNGLSSFFFHSFVTPHSSRCSSRFSSGAIISGFVCSSIVSVVVIAIYKNKPSDGIWRICFGIRAVMPLIIFFFRMRIMNSTQYQKHAIQDRKVSPVDFAFLIASKIER